MRFRTIVPVFALVAMLGCGDEKGDEKTESERRDVKTPADAMPVDLGEPNAPVQIRALQGAKEVRKNIEQQQKDAKPILDAAD